MGRADDMAQDSPIEEETFLTPGKPLVNLFTLTKLLEAAHGPEVAADFKNCQLNKTEPKFRAQIIDFLSKREDLISESICERLKGG